MTIGKSPSPSERRSARRSGAVLPSRAAAPADEESLAAVAPSQRLRLGPAAVACGIWIAVLITLAILSANPTTLNRAQILSAPFVVEAMSLTGNREEWRVSRSWPSGAVEDNIRIRGLAALPVEAGGRYLIPIERVDPGVYGLVLSPKPHAEPFIYPANPQTVSGLEELLRSHKN